MTGTGTKISKKLGMKHRWLKYYNMYINHDPVVALTYFTTRSTQVAYAFEWVKLFKCHLKGKTCRKLANRQEIIMKKKWSQGFICPFTGAIFHNIQTSLLVYTTDRVNVYKTIGPLV